MRAKLIMITLLTLPIFSFAGQSGYIRHGQTTIVYKDGVKVGDWPNDETAAVKGDAAAATAQKGVKKIADVREPASAQITNDTLYFLDDTSLAANKTVRCYSISNAIGFAKSEPVSCVRTDN